MATREERWPDLAAMRKEMRLSQSELAARLGVSPRTIQSCEQGWRNLGDAVEKTLLLLYMTYKHGEHLRELNCWEVHPCAEAQRGQCVTYLARLGFLCWFLSGNQCMPSPCSWEEKKVKCRDCVFFTRLLGTGDDRAVTPHGR